jgi:lycopene cyclase domain-containing protein
MTFVYLAALLFSLTGMVLLDRRFRLSFWQRPLFSAMSMATAVVFLLIWDLAGVANGIFFRGASSWMTGVLIAPEVPLEELFFLTLLSYVTLNAFGASQLWLSGRRTGQHSRTTARAPGATLDRGDSR